MFLRRRDWPFAEHAARASAASRNALTRECFAATAPPLLVQAGVTLVAFSPLGLGARSNVTR